MSSGKCAIVAGLLMTTWVACGSPGGSRGLNDAGNDAPKSGGSSGSTGGRGQGSGGTASGGSTGASGGASGVGGSDANTGGAGAPSGGASGTGAGTGGTNAGGGGASQTGGRVGSGGATSSGGSGGMTASGGRAATGGAGGMGTGGAGTGGMGTGGTRTGGSGTGGAGTGGMGTGGMGTGGAGTGGCNTDDVSNCGTCGHICPGPTAGTGTTTCVSKMCGINCGTAMLCGTACVATASDVNNCRSCGTKCTAPTAGTGAPICTATGCDVSCSGATPNKCGTTCVNVSTDRTNCGACGTVCALNTATCVAGTAASSCVCNRGYQGTGVACALEDECATGKHYCGTVTSGSCSAGTVLGYSCTCANGFVSSGGTFPQCYRSGTVTFGGTGANPQYSYSFINMLYYNLNDLSSGDFYTNDQDGAHTMYANNTGQGGLQRVVSTAALLDVPVPTTGYNRFGVPVLDGATYVSAAHTPDTNYYIVFRVTAMPASGFTFDWVMVYRP